MEKEYVICVDNSGCEVHLTLDRIYRVHQEDDGMYLIRRDAGQGEMMGILLKFRTSRFRRVPIDITNAVWSTP